MPSPEEMLAGWPGFLAARAMPDNKLAVAIQRGQEVFIGTVSLNGISIDYNSRRMTVGIDQRPINIKMITMGEDFIALSFKHYQQIEQDYHKQIPAYRSIEYK